MKRAGVFTVLMNPPRSGSSRQFINSAVKASPKKIVYISCGPESLKRDLQIFKSLGYRAQMIQPVDMFPFTEHIESIALLERVSNRKADAKVHIDVDLEDYYRIKDAQGKDGK